MENKRIVFLINSLDGGGAERVVSTLLNNLVDDYDCYLILLEDKISYELDSRIKIIILNNSSSRNGLIKFLSLPLLGYKLSKIIKEYNFSQVISFLYRSNYINILAKYLSKQKVIISERIAPSSMYADNSPSSKISKYLIKTLYNKADLIIPVSKAIKNDLETNFNIKTKQIVIYNPYDIDNIIKLSQEKINIEIDKENSIITVGSLGKRKNHSLLINAFSKVEKNLKLYILGVGGEEQNLKNLTINLGIQDRVIFLGFDNNPYKYLSKCSTFVLSSNSEGFPNVLAEAMICGCSVISTDCLSGPREILAPSSDIALQLKDTIEEEEFGILTPINNENKMIEAIHVMRSSDKYSHKAKERVVDFKIEQIIKEYKDVICVG